MSSTFTYFMSFSKGIHQNGGFTKVWISMKTVFGPWIFVATAWYWHRIGLMARPPVLLEKYESIKKLF